MSEAEELRRLGAVPQPNSGRGKHKKGDGVLDDEYVVDVKEYERSFGLSTTSWGKVCTDAVSQSMEPMLLIVLGKEGGPRTRLVVHTEEDFLEKKWKADEYDKIQEQAG